MPYSIDCNAPAFKLEPEYSKPKKGHNLFKIQVRVMGLFPASLHFDPKKKNNNALLDSRMCRSAICLNMK